MRNTAMAQELQQINKTCAEFQAEIYSAISEFKALLSALQKNVDGIANTVSTLNSDTVEFRTKLAYLKDDLTELKQYANISKSADDAAHRLEKLVSKLETSLESHAVQNDKDFANTKYDIHNIRQDIDKLPLLYVSKVNMSWGDFFKMAPGLIAVLTALGGLLVLWLRGAL